MRHGQSVWNRLNLFTGWVDVPLTQKGIDEALAGGDLIKDISIDEIHVSSLIRSQMTAMLAMSCHSSGKTPILLHSQGKMAEWALDHGDNFSKDCIPVYQSWHLNERMYGDLQGLNKDETRAKYGEEQVHIWRRSFDIPPPNGESLKMTADRTLPYFEEKIISSLKAGRNIFISAHGNSLRSIVMQLESLSTDQVLQLEIATGEPIIYDYDTGTFTKEVQTNG